jgi:hypothetical protein
MFLSGHFPILRGGVETLMAQVLLEQSQSITGIIQFHGVDGKGIPQPVRTDVTDSASLWILKFR